MLENVTKVEPLTLIPFNRAEFVFNEGESATLTVAGYEIFNLDPVGIIKLVCIYIWQFPFAFTNPSEGLSWKNVAVPATALYSIVLCW